MSYVYSYVEYDTLKEAKDDAYKDLDSTEIIDYLSYRGIFFENVIETFLENSANPKKFHEWMGNRSGRQSKIISMRISGMKNRKIKKNS